MARVRLDGVRKVYENGHVAVDDVTVEVRDGEFVVLVGPSGCGKSTTLRIIAGLESLSGGTLTIGDRVVNEVAPKDRDIAMVFQNSALYPHMSVAENLGFALALRRVPKAEIARRVREAAAVLGIEAILDRRPKQLSGGQRQRVAIGRAIVRDPAVFLFDEPLSNLDAKLRVQMRREIGALHRRLGATVVYVTHDQVEAMTMGERIVVMRDGRVQQIDAPLALYARPANRFVAGFIGSPAMNFLGGTLTRDDGLRFRDESGLVAFPLPEPVAARLAPHAGRRVARGVRPEHVAVGGDGRPGPAFGAPLTLRLDAVEPLGHEIVLHAADGDCEITARVPPQPLPAPGQAVTLLLDLGHAHWFAHDTEQAL
ncbi:MAG TPA: sn-glycerol-3-phosphate ABC transporter ATP-binding protein UgpC [Gemmatimonadaceae bacterium]|nr:sn-glycerol-3-phosphate ABC transporter ATP-binding protein UgpC [Gemmatimonadaceae bacterium]